MKMVAFDHIAGAGGAGGSGGTVAVDASGSVRAANVGVSARSIGGDGGPGGNTFTLDAASTVVAGAGGNGGDGRRGDPALVERHGPSRRQRPSRVDNGRPRGRRRFSNSRLEGARRHRRQWRQRRRWRHEQCGSRRRRRGHGHPRRHLQWPHSGVGATANGGDGGNGGMANGSNPLGGSGGTGGNGGAAGVGILGTVTFEGLNVIGQSSGQAILVQANGGGGGLGGDANSGIGQAGGGGFAGAGGGATLVLGSAAVTGIVRTSGNFAHGALVQSVGGGGGDGGLAAGFFTQGGAGAAGGNGGPVVVDAPNASVIATGSNSIALLAQSVGGGGGSGGDATRYRHRHSRGRHRRQWRAGRRWRHCHARSCSAACLDRPARSAARASWRRASAGPAGPAAMRAWWVPALLLMTIGGDAGGGGGGGAVDVTNQALITTYGDHAAGVQAQSIGGGGGKGGNAVAFNVQCCVPAVVGRGRRSGWRWRPGRQCHRHQPGTDHDLWRGRPRRIDPKHRRRRRHRRVSGGAHGDLSPDPDVPAISISVATGGKGGSGNTGGTVALDNSGLITTAGDCSIGVMAQSIGGGGGTGGDSTAASYAKGPQDGVSISISVAVGGSGGTGGTGGAVNVDERRDDRDARPGCLWRFRPKHRRWRRHRRRR